VVRGSAFRAASATRAGRSASGLDLTDLGDSTEAYYAVELWPDTGTEVDLGAEQEAPVVGLNTPGEPPPPFDGFTPDLEWLVALERPHTCVRGDVVVPVRVR
jgi:hypothetical protein